MARKFDTFPKLFEWKKSCPICSKELTYQMETSTFQQSKKNLTGQLEKYFQGMLSEKMEGKKISLEFKPSAEPITAPELNLTFKFAENKCLAKDLECASDLFNLKIYCEHNIIGRAYEASGSFDINIDLEDESLISKEDDKLSLNFGDIRIEWERYKIYNLHLEDEKPNGNIINITNDYYINKTSFSMAETNLDGTMGTWKEKRIELVGDDFFKFDKSEKIYSRMNALFLLQQ